MSPSIALVLWLVFIIFLFQRDHRNHPELTPALWLPVVWIFLLGSRSLGSWLSLGSADTFALSSYAEGNPIDRYSLLFMFALATWVVIKRKLNWPEIFNNNRAIFLFIFYCLLSSLWSEFPSISLKRLIRFSGIIPMSVLILSEPKPIAAVIAVIRRASYILVTLSFLFIRYFPEYGRYYNPFSYETAYSGVCGNKNELGILCLVASLVFIWDILRGGISFFKKIDGWLTVLMLLTTAYLIRIANSATALFCIIIGSLILIGTTFPIFKKNPKTIAPRIFAIGLFAAGIQIVFNISALVIKLLGRDPTLTNRSHVWKVLLGMGTNPLFGVGYGSFWTTGRLSSLWANGIGAIQSHNGYIDTYLNLGIIGVLFFLLLLARCYQLVSRHIGADFAFNQFRLAVLVIFIFYNYTEAVFPGLGLLSALFFLMITIVPRALSSDGGENEPVHVSRS